MYVSSQGGPARGGCEDGDGEQSCEAPWLGAPGLAGRLRARHCSAIQSEGVPGPKSRSSGCVTRDESAFKFMGRIVVSESPVRVILRRTRICDSWSQLNP